MTLTIKMVQRTAETRTAETQYKIVKNYHSSNGDISVLPIDRQLYGDTVQIGSATVIHPAIMIGSREDIETNIQRAIMNEVERQPGITANKYGVLFAS